MFANVCFRFFFLRSTTVGRFTGKKNQDVFDEEEIIKLLGMPWIELGDFQKRFLNFLETVEVSRADVVNTFDG